MNLAKIIAILALLLTQSGQCLTWNPHLVKLYDTLQWWWITDTPSPQPLLMFRVATAALCMMVFGFQFYTSIRPNEIELSWTPAQIMRARVISWLKTLSTAGIAIYFIAATVLEYYRDSSPHKLLFANAAITAYMLATLMDLVFWRIHYLRKRSRLSSEGKRVAIK